MYWSFFLHLKIHVLWIIVLLYVNVYCNCKEGRISLNCINNSLYCAVLPFITMTAFFLAERKLCKSLNEAEMEQHNLWHDRLIEGLAFSTAGTLMTIHFRKNAQVWPEMTDVLLTHITSTLKHEHVCFYVFHHFKIEVCNFCAIRINKQLPK